MITGCTASIRSSRSTCSQHFRSVSIYSRTNMPRWSSICSWVRGIMNLAPEVISNSFLLMRPITNSMESPSVSLRPAMSTQARELSCLSMMNLGKKVCELIFEWPILKWSGTVLESSFEFKFAFKSMSLCVIVLIFCGWPAKATSFYSLIFLSSRASGPRINELSIVDLPQPVNPRAIIIFLPLRFSKFWKAI